MHLFMHLIITGGTIARTKENGSNEKSPFDKSSLSDGRITIASLRAHVAGRISS